MLVLLLSVLLFAQEISASPPPTPEGNRTAEPSGSKITKKNEKRESAQYKTDNLSSAINELSTAIRDNKTNVANEHDEEKMKIERESLKAEEKVADETEKLAMYTDRLASLTRLLVVVGAVQIGVFFWQLILMNKAARDAGKSAEAALKTAKSMQAADRAYIKISHDSNALTIYNSAGEAFWGPERTYAVHIEVTNIGKTPARLTDLVITPYFHASEMPLPPKPPYDPKPDRKEVQIIMHGTDMISPRCDLFMTMADFEVIHDHPRTKQFILLIYVDYIDHFEVRHRAGYARRYDPDRRENNLLIVTQRDYNYDRECKPCNGNNLEEPN